MRGDRLAVILALAVSPDAWADHAHAAAPVAVDPHDALAQQLTDEAAAIDRALATVSDKLGLADTARARRIRAAYRLIHEPTGGDPMATARKRSAAGLLLARDAMERDLLADELARLHTAKTRTATEATQLPTVTLPTDLARPAHGKTARHFGTLEHERSKTTLSRRGIDIEVEEQADVVAPGTGVVRYAGPIRGLESGAIIDHGDYFTVVAKLGELTIPVGTVINRGDHLGHAAGHRVYLEVRVKVGPGGLPIDPEPLLAH